MAAVVGDVVTHDQMVAERLDVFEILSDLTEFADKSVHLTVD